MLINKTKGLAQSQQQLHKTKQNIVHLANNKVSLLSKVIFKLYEKVLLSAQFAIRLQTRNIEIPFQWGKRIKYLETRSYGNV